MAKIYDKWLRRWLVGAAAFVAVVCPVHAIIDKDGDGMSDIWEELYGLSTTDNGEFLTNGDPGNSDEGPDADPDGDGLTNFLESIAGTDPFSGEPAEGFLQTQIAQNPAVPGVFVVSWPTKVGKQYKLRVSLDLTPGSWTQVGDPIIGDGTPVEIAIDTTNNSPPAPKLFWLTAVAEIDSDMDGLSDYDEGIIGTDPKDADTDKDKVGDAGEKEKGTNPKDPNDRGDVEWFVIEGNKAQGQPKTDTRTYTIKKGQTRVLVVGTTSEEYPDWTENGSEFNDTLSWEITPSAGAIITGTINVNDRHDDWDADLLAGVELNGFSPVHIETVTVIQAPANADVTVTVKLTATNISDGELPSTVIVALIPVEIQRDEEGGQVEWQSIENKMAIALPGQKMNLKVDLSHLPETFTITNKLWTLNGETFADYAADSKTATLTPVTEYSTEQSHFYWANSGDHLVNFYCAIAGKDIKISTTISVKKPVSTLTSEMGAVIMNDSGTSIGPDDGISYRAKVDSLAPDFDDEGDWQFVQLVTDRSYGNYANGDKIVGNNWGDNVLDTSYPYAPQNGIPTKTGVRNTGYDYPKLNLSGDCNEMGVANDFEMYLMFRAPGNNSKWVPLKVLKWNYKGKATRSGSTWSTVSGSLGGTAEASGSDTHQHPTWKANFAPHKWVPKPQ